MSEPEQSERLFDTYAAEYDAALARGLSSSGETKDYFARGRVNWLAACLGKKKQAPKKVLDFGCGTGSGAHCLGELLGSDHVMGVDVSPMSIEIAARHACTGRVEFRTLKDYTPVEQMDLAFCNGVFHHIPPAERADAVRWVLRALRRGGFFSFWENNPWNPGTRYVMSRIPFDRDAITLSPPEARRLLQREGFEILQMDFLFYFPRALACLRPLERMLTKLPLGGQYQILARKPF